MNEETEKPIREADIVEVKSKDGNFIIKGQVKKIRRYDRSKQKKFDELKIEVDRI